MGLTYVGELAIGPCIPTSVSAVAALAANLAVNIASLLELQVGLGAFPPSISASLTALVELTTSLNLAISFSLPYVDAQVTAIAQAIASLTADLVPCLALQLTLNGGAGIFAFGFNGTGAAFGSSITNELSASWPDGSLSSGTSNAIILATVTSSVWTDILTVFNAIPPSLPQGLTFLAQLNIGTLCPSILDATASITAQFNAQLNGLIALAASIAASPPSLAGNVSIAADLTASLNAALMVTLPGVSFQLAAVAKLIATINAQISALAALTVAFTGASGVFAYTYSGPGDGLGPAVTTALSSGWPDSTPLTAPANALVLGTTVPAVWATMGLFFGGL
jgi:hypothetical protein